MTILIADSNHCVDSGLTKLVLDKSTSSVVSPCCVLSFSVLVAYVFVCFDSSKSRVNLDNRSHGDKTHTHAFKVLQAAPPATLGVISVPPRLSLNSSLGPFPNHIWMISLWSGCRRYSDHQITWQQGETKNHKCLFVPLVQTHNLSFYPLCISEGKL